MQEDDLQAAREKAARARERHQQEQEQRRRKLWPRKDESEEGVLPMGLDGVEEGVDSKDEHRQADLPGLQEVMATPDREDLEEDWEDWMEEEEADKDYYAGDEFGDLGTRDLNVAEEDGYEPLDVEDDDEDEDEDDGSDFGAVEQEVVGEPGELTFYREPPAAPAPVVAALAPAAANGGRELAQQQDEKKARLDQLKDEMERIERERRHLESLRRKQEEYERSKVAAASGLKRQLGVISRELLQMEELTKELQTTRTRFETILKELDAIQEESWLNSELEERLNEAVGRVEVAREEMSRAESRLKVLRPEPAAQAPRVERPKAAASVAAPAVARPAAPMSEATFSDLVKRGLAYSLPGIVTALFLFLLLMIFLILQQSAMIY